eukprot:Ihof_evm3s809 gene=Ihof_evmTU3s809
MLEVLLCCLAFIMVIIVIACIFLKLKALKANKEKLDSSLSLSEFNKWYKKSFAKFCQRKSKLHKESYRTFLG